jgi:hypothetical protein
MAVSLIQNALEGKAARAEDIGRQFLTYGHRCDCQHFLTYVVIMALVTSSWFPFKVYCSNSVTSRAPPELKEYRQRADVVEIDSM